jgi:hypothetical protein
VPPQAKSFVKEWYRNVLDVAIVLLVVLVMPARATQELRITERRAIGNGWHPWYEIKADPEDSRNLIVCGTKWDGAANSPFGFIYASSNGGATWQTALEDRSTNWVTEHSCAFGSQHRAYFISEAATVIDGEPQEEGDATRLFVSTDGGQHWVKTIKTGWADYSTSAVNSVSGSLYTFFNSWNTTRDLARNWGGNVGLLVFSKDGREVAGPYFNSAVRDLGYVGIFPKDALALRSGVVVALYLGKRQTRVGWAGDLGVIRANLPPEPSLETTVISHPRMDNQCFNFSDASLTYDTERNRLFLVYLDGCKDTSRMMLTLSRDEGKTWTHSTVVADPRNVHPRAYAPSLAVSQSGALALLWEEGEDRRSGRWLLSYVRDLKLVEPLTELVSSSGKYEVDNDSLWTSVGKADEADRKSPFDSNALTLSVHSELNSVWRSSGLIAAGDRLLAVWPSASSGQQHLHFGVLGAHGAGSVKKDLGNGKESSGTDMTLQSTILYAGPQSFDSMTGTLKVNVRLANRGYRPFKVPIKLEAKEIRSAMGIVSVLNASNGLPGAGAMWDISDSVTGNQIPPNTSSHPFCLSFHLEISPGGASPLERDELLFLKIKVVASDEGHARDEKEEKN